MIQSPQPQTQPSEEPHPTETFQQFVDARYNLQSMGSYDYIYFLKKMKEVDFRKMIYDEYLYDRTKSNKYINK